MMRRTAPSCARSALAGLCLIAMCPASLAQGRSAYLNVESPQVHPIEVANVAGHDFLLVCNTPDNSVEIYDTDEGPSDPFIARVPVGMEPVSVRFIPQLNRFVTADFLGDSLSVVELSPGSGAQILRIAFEKTVEVGDEPLDVAYYPLAGGSGGEQGATDTLFVTFMNPDAFGWFDAASLRPVSPGLEEIAASFILDSSFDPPLLQALKQPRSVLLRQGELVLLGHKVDVGKPNDMAINCRDPLSLASGDLSGSLRVGGLGTTHFNMALASNGDLFVVGGKARNDIHDEPNVANAPSGFVESMLYLVRDVCSGQPGLKKRNLNLEPASPIALSGLVKLVPGQPMILTGPVDKDEALAQPTDLALFEENGTVTKVFVSAFGSDRIGVIEPDFNQKPILWPIGRIDIAPLSARRAGPRGLVLKNTAAGPGRRLYVLNRLDSSVTVINPVTEQKVDQFPLRHDPTPAWVRDGRPFLYNADLSGSGFNSCAGCHVDGRTDALPWDLGTPGQEEKPIDPKLLDGVSLLETATFPADKGNMVTQSLQGLLNWEVQPGSEGLITNAPYHWRGDRQDLAAFNVAFKDLLKGKELSPGDLRSLTEFVDSIQYGPNPKQPRNRRYSGSFGDPDVFVFGGDGSSGAQRGLKIFHTVQVLGESSCVRCHALPEGSNNRLTVNDAPTESAALRGLFQKEGKRDRDGFTDPQDAPYTGLFGMIHTGFADLLPKNDPLQPYLINGVGSTNAFVNLVFQAGLCPQQEPFCDDGKVTSQYVHELDWGTGPLVGRPLTVRLADAAQANQGAGGCDPSATNPDGILDCMEQQAREANSGVAVLGQVNGQARGFWFNPVIGRYREEPGGSVLTRGLLLNLIQQQADYLVFTASPLGSERRMAAPNGMLPAPLTGPSPASVALLPMRPNTANRDIPLLDRQWADLDNQREKSIFVHTVRVYQNVLVEKGQELEQQGFPGFGLDRVRHDAPRRFRIAGRNLRHGAELHLFSLDFPDDQTIPTNPPDFSQVQPGQVPVREWVFPLYATAGKTPDGRPIWETAVELAPLVYYQLMLGWLDAPGVLAVYDDVDSCPSVDPEVPPCFHYSDPPTATELLDFDPAAWNFHFVRVINQDGTRADGGWQRLTIE